MTQLLARSVCLASQGLVSDSPLGKAGVLALAVGLVSDSPLGEVRVLGLAGTPGHLKLGHALLQPLHTLLFLLQPLRHLNIQSWIGERR